MPSGCCLRPAWRRRRCPPRRLGTCALRRGDSPRRSRRRLRASRFFFRCGRGFPSCLGRSLRRGSRPRLATGRQRPACRSGPWTASSRYSYVLHCLLTVFAMRSIALLNSSLNFCGVVPGMRQGIAWSICLRTGLRGVAAPRALVLRHNISRAFLCSGKR